MDTALPFGLHMYPKIFTVVADGVLWIMGHNRIRQAIHYLDDYLFFVSPGSQECVDALRLVLSLCKQVGRQYQKEKIEGPATVLPSCDRQYCSKWLQFVSPRATRLTYILLNNLQKMLQSMQK